MQNADLQATSELSLSSNSYIYSIVSCPERPDIAAISSDDSLRIIDATRLQETNKGTYRNVHAGVTCLRLLPDQSNILLTAGRDAAIRGWDIRSGEKLVEMIDRMFAFPHFISYLHRL